MQQHIFTRYTTIAIVLFTCCLTFDVNARERELNQSSIRLSPTKLTPEAMRLLSDATALLEGFTPAIVTPFELTPRRKVKKTMPIRMENSRVKVKFADELQIRLDVHNQIYSRSGRSSETISDLVNALGLTLTPVHTDSQASIDALIRRAELHSGKQQPDISGTYWVEGEYSSIDVAAELFYTMEEVEWVIYQPLLIRPTAQVSNSKLPTTTKATPKKQNIQAKAKPRALEFGACWFRQNDCESDLEKFDCIDYGGIFLGNNSICRTSENTKQERNAVPEYINGDWCGTIMTPEDQRRMQRMLDDGTWESFQSQSAQNRNSLLGGSIVNMTMHIVRYSDGSGGIDEQTLIDQVAIHNARAIATGLTWCITGDFVYHDSDALVDEANEPSQLDVGFVDNTINVYCVPEFPHGGWATFPPGTALTLNNGNILFSAETLSHELGHYFALPHTFEGTADGSNPEPVDPADPNACNACGFSGDFICDTPADVQAGGGQTNCIYNGTVLDLCGSGLLYDPLVDNLMSYYLGCTDSFTPEQINVIIGIAATSRLNLLSATCNAEPPATGACCLADESCVDGQTQTDCTDMGGIYQGPDTLCAAVTCTATNTGACCLPTNTCRDNETLANCTNLGGTFHSGDTCAAGACDNPPVLTDAICCLFEASGGMGPGCQEISQDECLDYNGVYMPADEPEEDEDICDGFTDCPIDIGPNPYPETCGEYNDFPSYFAGDCYIDQTTCLQQNRIADGTVGCLDTPEEIINGNYVVRTDAPAGPGTVYDIQSCCTTVMENVPYCATAPWDIVCASIAISFAAETPGEEDGPCFRDLLTSCEAVFGTIQGARRQAKVDTEAAGLNLNFIFDLPTDIVIDFEIFEEDGRFLNLYFDNEMEQLNLGGSDISSAATWIQSAAELHDVYLTAQCCAWDGCCEGSEPSDFCEQAAQNCLKSGTFLITQPRTTLNENTKIYASLIEEGNTNCLSSAGFPSVVHVSPSASNGPDFASMGLLTWMSEEYVPNVNLSPILENRFALPYSTQFLTSDELTQLYQLLPWPMGGVSSGEDCQVNVAVPVLSPEGTINFGGEGVNLFPNPGNPGGFGQSDIYKGAYGYGQKFADQTNSVQPNGAFGNNVRVAVLDWSAHLQAQTNNANIKMGGIHAELTHVILEGADTGHDPLDLIFDENLEGPQWYPFSADHGTGVLGIIGAQWGPNSAPGVSLETRLANNVGVLGLVPDADIYFFPLASQQEATGRQPTAWLHAMQTLNAGDVLCAAYKPIISNGDTPNLNFLDDINNYIELANSLGICVVIAAGEGRGAGTIPAVDLGGLEPNGGDQGAIVATAVSPGLPYKRWANGSSGSNYTTAPNYAIVTASGWGMGVTTCGKGPNRDNFVGYNTCIYQDPTNAHEVHQHAYTNNFEGTRSAAAVVAGSAAMVQGFTKQLFDIPMSALILRQLIAGGRFEGSDKEGQPIMSPPDYSTEDNSSDCELPEPRTWDWDLCSPLAVGWRTGSFINPLTSMRNAVYNPIFDTPNVQDLIILRGTWQIGNIYSIASDDGNLFGASGVPTAANQAYSIPATVPGGHVRYPLSGNVTDIYLYGELGTSLPASNELTVDINFEETQPDGFYLRLEMWDYRRNSWEQAAGTASVVQGTEDVDFLIENASRYIDRDTFEYHLRLISTVTNLPGDGSQPPYPILYDQIILKTGLTQVPQP